MQRTLKCALEIVGSEKTLARRLLVPVAELQAWLRGEDKPPKAVFLAAVDIVVGTDHTSSVPYERRRKPRHPHLDSV